MKKVSYTVRKDVADKRLRIKGRFIKQSDQNDIMQRIFADEPLSQTNVQRLNQDLNDIVNAPDANCELLAQAASAPTKSEKSHK